MSCQFKNRFGKCFAAKPRVSAFGGSSAGAVAVVTAIVLPVILGFASLGTEVGHWYFTQRVMQGSADAAAISATAQYIQDAEAGNPNSTTYQTVGVNYASLNGGFTIPTSNVCLVKSSGNNCASVLALDSRAIVCASPPCVVVEITQNTATWLSTKASFQPGIGQIVQAIPTPTLMARAVVSTNESTVTTTTNGADCILALARANNAVTVEGGGDLVAKCGVAIDGGIDQNANGTPLGGINFAGSNAKAEIASLVIAGNYTQNQECLYSNGQHCYLYDPKNSPPAGTGSTTVLPASDFESNTATQDPYAAAVTAMFQSGGIGVPPLGVASVTINTRGSGYTNGTRTFTLTGGNNTAPAQILATVSGGTVTAILGVFDPGAYGTVPGGQPGGNPDTGGGSGATFKLTEGCFAWPGTSVGGVAWTPIPGRKYCSIYNHGQGKINFPVGNYYIAGGDGNCVGLCQSGSNAVMTSAVAGVTFFLTNGEGTGTYGTSSYATMSIQSGTVNLCSPGTNCGTTCTNSTATSCMLIIQNPAAPLSTGLKTINNIVNGNGANTLAGLVYLRTQTFSTVGGASIGGCFGVIAYYVDIGGTPEFSNGCLPGNGIGGTTTTTTTFSTPYLYQ
jgi:Flp pilus assembly protein TadG